MRPVVVRAEQDFWVFVRKMAVCGFAKNQPHLTFFLAIMDSNLCFSNTFGSEQAFSLFLSGPKALKPHASVTP